jgi:putative ABC transport system permease protein
MKTDYKLIIRKMRSHTAQLLGLVLLLVVGVAFFVTLFTIVWQFEKTAEEFIADFNYADVTLYGEFTQQDVNTLLQTSGVITAQGRNVRDFREDDIIIRAISLTDGINELYFYGGRLPENENECVILKRNADAMGYSVGDTITLGGNKLLITGLVASPEYIYMVQNERNMMANTSFFGVVYVVKEFFNENYNEIAVLTGANVPVSKLSAAVNTFRAISQSDQINHYMYRNDLDELSTFAYIFPLVFAVLIAVVIYVMLTRAVQKDRRQIGVMKAMGQSDKKIISIYLSQFCITAIIGSLLGCFLAVLICDFVIAELSSMFLIPALSYAFEPILWLVSVLISVCLCAVSSIIALLRILPLMPSAALRPRIPKGGRKILIERISFIWKRLSFNTRYALKNSFRNKSRFFAIVLGMTGSISLLAFSLAFYDSIDYTQSKFFDDFAEYDIIVNFNPMPLFLNHSSASQIDESRKALTIYIDIDDEHYRLTITENDFDMLNISAEDLQNGVIIPEYFAKIWNAEVGGIININGYNAVISAIIPQHLSLTLYTSYDYIRVIIDEIPPVYNMIFGRSNNLPVLTGWLVKNNIDFSTIDDDRNTFDSIMETMSLLIWLMVGCSVILGFTVLYAVGLINLSAREYEYMFMGVMGYSHKSIITAHIKETVLQLIAAIPLGFITANLLLMSIIGEFSSSNFVVAAVIFPNRYITAAIAAVLVTAVMTIVTSKHIDRLDIIEGLKAHDDG